MYLQSNYHHFYAISRPILGALLLFFCLSCDNEPTETIESIVISVDKTLALHRGDSIVIEAVAITSNSNVSTEDNFEYFANEVPLNGNVFYPDTRGDYTLTARFANIVSNEVTVQVADPAVDLTELIMVYEGMEYLTTKEWSLSGTFRFEGEVGGETYSIANPDIQLYHNGEVVSGYEHFHFETAGTVDVQAKLGLLESNIIQLQVRPEKTFDMVVIPVVFHCYGEQLTQPQIDQLIDTLNGSFNRSTYSAELVKQGWVNPNAVDCFIRFEKALVPPLGFTLNEPGLHIVPTPNNEFPLLNLDQFRELEEAHSWPPETYVNIWMASDFGFEFPAVNINERGHSNARGLANSPFVVDTFLAGIPTVGANPRDPDPNSLYNGILVRSGSVLIEHPDFLVNRMGYYLGLFDNNGFYCSNNGDYCEDTFSYDIFSQELGPFNSLPTCRGPFYHPNTHMDLRRNKACFTYDQRERMRFVLRHGLFRPKEG